MVTEKQKKERNKWKNRTPEQIKKSKAQRKKRYLKYKKEENEQSKKRIAKYRAEHGMERDKKWRKENADKIKIYKKNYNIKHQDQLKKYTKKYNIINKEQNRIRSYAHRYLRDKLIKERKKCEICGSKKDLQIHHIKYNNDEENLMVVCRKCHHWTHRGEPQSECTIR